MHDHDLRDIDESQEIVDRRMVATDLWPRRFLERRQAQKPVLPAKVIWPNNEDDVKAVIKEAARAKTPVVPFGAGSGVCAGISPSEKAWVIDLKRLNKVLHVDAERMLCTVQAGMIGERFERELNTHGLSLGHFPSSIYCSTVGGWVAARSAGQLSSRYGKIEDLVFALRGIDGCGREISASLDDPDTGPAALRLLMGAEGALFVITEITFRVHAIAAHRWMRGFFFDDLTSALPAVHSLLTRGLAPSVIRVYDPLDTWFSGASPPEAEPDPDRVQAGGIAQAGLEHSGPKAEKEHNLLDSIAERAEELALFQHPGATRKLVGKALAHPLILNTIAARINHPSKAIIGVEGDAKDVAKRAEAIRRTLCASGAIDAGTSLGAKWLLHRHRFSYKMSRVFAVGGWTDTMEVATGWDNVIPLYEAVKDALRDVALVMCHFSHAYIDGCSLYFVMAGGGTGKGRGSAMNRYDLAWERALMAVRKAGGAISHHHGIGRSKATVLRRPEIERRVFTQLRQELDPHHILNPGVLGMS